MTGRGLKDLWATNVMLVIPLAPSGLVEWSRLTHQRLFGPKMFGSIIMRKKSKLKKIQEGDNLALVNLSIHDVANIRHCIKMAIGYCESTLDKFIEQKKPKRIIKEAFKNIEHLKEKLNYLEDNLHYQDEWIKKYNRIYNYMKMWDY